MTTTSSGYYLIEPKPQTFLKDIEWPKQSEEAKVEEFWKTKKNSLLNCSRNFKKKKNNKQN